MSTLGEVASLIERHSALQKDYLRIRFERGEHDMVTVAAKRAKNQAKAELDAAIKASKNPPRMIWRLTVATKEQTFEEEIDSSGNAWDRMLSILVNLEGYPNAPEELFIGLRKEPKP